MSSPGDGLFSCVIHKVLAEVLVGEEEKYIFTQSSVINTRFSDLLL